MMTPEQMIAAQKANVESLFGLTEKAFSGVEKMVELNMAAAKAALQDNLHQTQALFSVKDVQELMALQAGYLQPLAEKAAAFNRHVYEIASSTGSEFTKAVEAKAAEAQKAVAGMVDDLRGGVVAELRELLGFGLRDEPEVNPLVVEVVLERDLP